MLPEPYDYAFVPAAFSGDRKYRYLLRRRVALGGSDLMVVMLNPSTADEEKNDPTIRRCIDFANRWGYGSLTVCNLYAYRTTEPDELRRVVDPVGPENDAHLSRQAHEATRIMCGWGEHGGDRAQAFYRMALAEDFNWKLECWGVNASGQPKHPLYVPRTVLPMSWPRSVVHGNSRNERG